jgi:hypothetical protein
MTKYIRVQFILCLYLAGCAIISGEVTEKAQRVDVFIKIDKLLSTSDPVKILGEKKTEDQVYSTISMYFYCI